MKPLAERMRPANFDEYVGQRHLVGKNGVLRSAIESGNIPSFILWGPPGVGKTTLAKIMSHLLERPFYTLSAVHSGVKDIREESLKSAKSTFFYGSAPHLLIDEIHRFNKSQQDSLLGAVEEGVVTLIGATTENPSFEVIPALLSRCQVYVFQPLEKEDLIFLVQQALEKDEYLHKKNIEVESYDALLRYSGGDARKLYNILEIMTGDVADGETLIISDESVSNKIQQNIATYDKGGEHHYDVASAFIKSIRGSDPNAAVYWLARMIKSREDVKFIARRIMISAAEDIGLANPNALLMAATAFQAVQAVGFPESRIILSEAVIYLATSPKSNSAYQAINRAQELVKRTGGLPVPLHLRNAPSQLMKDLDYGKDYRYAHDFGGNFVDQNFTTRSEWHKLFSSCQANSTEQKIAERLQQRDGKEKYGY